MNFKKLIALVLAAVMMMGVTSALADYSTVAGEATTPTGKLTITGLENDDTVYLYKVIRWVDAATAADPTKSGDGNWQVVSQYNSVSDNVSYFKTIDAAKAIEIADLASDDTLVATETAADNKVEKTLPVGMYLALVKSAGSTVYNPMILSVNWDDSNAKDSSLAADTENLTSTVAVAKKTPITLTKDVDTTSTDITDLARNVGDKAKGVKVGDTVPFTVTTVIPTYADKDRNLVFKVTDTLSDGLVLDQNSIVVKVGENTLTRDNEYTLTTDTDNYVVTFSQNYLRADKGAHNVTITYRAQITEKAIMHNVERYNNEVKLDFTNGPKDETDSLTSETNHYTFSLDASAIGNDGGRNYTSELVKIGKADDGTIITAWKTIDGESWNSVNPLAGAKFRLVGENVDLTTETNAAGQISFYGLDAGTYTLTETEAPAGYVKDSTSKTITITANYGGTNGDELISYEVLVDGAKSRYTITNDAVDKDRVSFDSISSTNDTFPIINTQGLELPTTGGIGTTLFYLIGGLMVLAAGIFLVARRKAEE